MPFINKTDLDAALASMDGDFALELLRKAHEGLASDRLRAEADAAYGREDIEIDDYAATAPADDGTWVAAWVWMPNDEANDDDDEDDPLPSDALRNRL